MLLTCSHHITYIYIYNIILVLCQNISERNRLCFRLFLTSLIQLYFMEALLPSDMTCRGRAERKVLSKPRGDLRQSCELVSPAFLCTAFCWTKLAICETCSILLYIIWIFQRLRRCVQIRTVVCCVMHQICPICTFFFAIFPGLERIPLRALWDFCCQVLTLVPFSFGILGRRLDA